MEADVNYDGLSFTPTLECGRIAENGQQSGLAQMWCYDYREGAAHDGRIGFDGLACHDRKS